MLYSFLADYKPAAFFHWFGLISAIPRGSGNHEPFLSFLRDYAEQRGYTYSIDAGYNVYMTIPATSGYEKEPSILFQAHYDIVCAQNPGRNFDFENSPLDLLVKGDSLIANGTTLGADNGVGVATMLALGDDASIAHPPLEFLFTADEEVDLVGIRLFDMSKIRSRRMLNMDTGYSHIICRRTAGLAAGEVRETFPLSASAGNFYHIRISGGLGGHAGIEINKGRCCTVNLMGNLLADLSGEVRIAQIATSDKAIMKSCEVTLSVSESQLSDLKAHFDGLKTLYEQADPDIAFSAEPCVAVPCTSAADSERIISLMQLFHTGPFFLDAEDPSVVVSCAAIDRFSFSDGCLRMRYAIRSCNNYHLDTLFNKCKRICSLLNMEFILTDKVTGWPEQNVSPFRDKFVAAHRKVCGFEPEFERPLSVAETGIIVGAIPDMDCVGYAPSAHGAHTPDEYLVLSEVQPYWDVLLEVLQQKDQLLQF